MAKYIIEGGHKLKGKIKTTGNKNAILPIMVACLLTKEEIVLENVPKISDVLVLGKLMAEIGCKIEGLGTERLILNCAHAQNWQLNPQLTSQLRGSVLLLGPLLSRFGRFETSYPGGDIVGRRPLETHFLAFKKLGAEIKNEAQKYQGQAKKLTGAKIFLDEASVTATENAIMAAVLARGKTIIKNAACEPHVKDLCNFLVKMGAKISGLGSNILEIEGVGKLSGIKHRISPDNIEAGTYAIAAAVTGGELQIEDVAREDLEMPLLYFGKMGLRCEMKDLTLKVYPSKISAISKIDAGIWPALPTDLMSCMIVLCTQAEGVTLCRDFLFESRMFFVDKLISMGAQVTICDPHRVLVYGPAKLHGQKLDTPDIRAGMALVVAALCAQGHSEINKVELIERGYEDVVGRLTNLGAKIQRVE